MAVVPGYTDRTGLETDNSVLLLMKELWEAILASSSNSPQKSCSEKLGVCVEWQSSMRGQWWWKGQQGGRAELAEIGSPSFPSSPEPLLC